MSVGTIYPSAQWSRNEADHSRPSRPEVKNGWSYTATPAWRVFEQVDSFIVTAAGISAYLETVPHFICTSKLIGMNHGSRQL
jgi:hypothetical protein